MIDEKDKIILEILKNHGDYTTRKIARKTILPTTTIYNRIKKLKETGVIKRFSIEVDNDKIGKSFAAYILISANLKELKSKGKTQYDVENELHKLPWIEKVSIVSGGTDIIAFVRARDVHEYDEVLLGKIQLIEGIDNTQSLIVLHGD